MRERERESTIVLVVVDDANSSRPATSPKLISVSFGLEEDEC
jgi:hypothetical protein